MAAQLEPVDDAMSERTSVTHVPSARDLPQAPDIMLSRADGEIAIADSKSEKGEVKVAMTESEDDWEVDPINPRNWPSTKKWVSTAIVASFTFVSPLSSSMMAPGLPEIADKYDITSSTVGALCLSIFLLSYALGPLILAPLSEMYGRKWVLFLGNIGLLAFNLGCALAPNAGALIAFRFLAGLAGSAPIACGGGTVSDLFSERDRATAMALYSLGPLLGPAIGPIMGGFIAENAGVSYVFYVTVALCGIVSIVGFLFLHETYAPIIRRRRDEKAEDPEKAAIRRAYLTENSPSKWQYLWVNIMRPAILLTRSFVCFMLSLYQALMYGIYYLMFATFPNLFTDVYHFNTGISGLAYIGLGFGFVSATLFGANISNKIYLHQRAKNGGVGKPEMRIPALMFGSLFVPVGLFWYGWSAQAQIHWIMPIIGTGIFGFGLMTTFLPISLYLVDTFAYAASAVAAASVLRSFLGFVFPLFGEQMYAKLGYGGGNSLLAGLAIVLGIPFPIWIYYNGEQIRARSSLAR